MDTDTTGRYPAEQDVADAVALAKREVLDMIDEGVVPADVADFSELHDYTDANCLGGLCDEGGPIDWPISGDDDSPDQRVIIAVDEWLIAGRPAD